MHKYKKKMKGRNFFKFVKTAPEISFIAITWLSQGMFINAHKCFQSRFTSMNLHHVKELVTLCIRHWPCRKLKKLKTTIFPSGP